VKLIEVGRDQLAKGIVPGAKPNPVSRGDTSPVGLFCTEIRAPGAIPSASFFGEGLTVGVGTFQTAEISAVAEPDAGDEKGHRVPLLRGLLPEHHRYTEGRDENCRYKNKYTNLFHSSFPFSYVMVDRTAQCFGMGCSSEVLINIYVLRGNLDLFYTEIRVKR
jgi:hypothetical protein